jgi:hypothetical protein
MLRPSKVLPSILQSPPEMNIEEGGDSRFMISSIQIKTKKLDSSYFQAQDPLISKKWLDKKHK